MNASAAIADATPHPRREIARCPHCDEVPPIPFRTREQIAAELALRDAFFARGQRDLTNMLLGTPAGILRCGACGILIRDEAPDQGAFREDRYDRTVLEALHAVHHAAFGEKEPEYRPLLRPGGRVVEIGSYVGGFLSTARRWGWSAIGVDIGNDTSRFTRSLGFDVRSTGLEECHFERESFDAAFIWNCFEQLEVPRIVLGEAHRVLRSRGILVLRVPDADFYVRCRSVASLAYNGLLGWPHRFGFDAAALCRLAAEHGFAFQRMLRAPAILPLRMATRVSGWIEGTFRKK